MKSVKMPDKVKDYFETGPRKIDRVIPNEDYSLTIHFDNEEIKIYNMNDKLFGVFKVLKNKSKFNKVFLDEYGNIAWDIDDNIDSSIHWNNRIDLCTDSVYLASDPLN